MWKKLIIYLGLGLFFCVIIYTSFRNLSTIFRLKAELEDRKRFLALGYLDIIKAKEEEKFVNTSYFVEQQARQVFNMYKSGETKIVILQTSEAYRNNRFFVYEKKRVQPKVEVSPWDEWLVFLSEGVV